MKKGVKKKHVNLKDSMAIALLRQRGKKKIGSVREKDSEFD